MIFIVNLNLFNAKIIYFQIKYSSHKYKSLYRMCCVFAISSSIETQKMSNNTINDVECLCLHFIRTIKNLDDHTSNVKHPHIHTDMLTCVDLIIKTKIMPSAHHFILFQQSSAPMYSHHLHISFIYDTLSMRVCTTNEELTSRKQKLFKFLPSVIIDRLVEKYYIIWFSI